MVLLASEILVECDITVDPDGLTEDVARCRGCGERLLWTSRDYRLTPEDNYEHHSVLDCLRAIHAIARGWVE